MQATYEERSAKNKGLKRIKVIFCFLHPLLSQEAYLLCPMMEKPELESTVFVLFLPIFFSLSTHIESRPFQLVVNLISSTSPAKGGAYLVPSHKNTTYLLDSKTPQNLTEQEAKARAVKKKKVSSSSLI